MSDVKRNEHTLPIANWLREQINETLSKYDVPSDVYDTDISIDALCVCAVDKAQGSLRARLEAVEKERDEWVRDVWTARGFQAEAETRAERAEAALATARRDALEFVAMAKLADAALAEAEAILGGEYGDQYAPLCAQIDDFRFRIRAITAQEEPTT